MGFTAENVVSQAYRDGRLTSIGGGADEIMLQIICKLMNISPKGALKMWILHCYYFLWLHTDFHVLLIFNKLSWFELSNKLSNRFDSMFKAGDKVQALDVGKWYDAIVIQVGR